MVNKLPLSDEEVSSLTAMMSSTEDKIVMQTSLPWLNAARLVAQASYIKVTPLSSVEVSLEDIAKAWHCRLRSVNLSGEWWKTDNGPLLAYHQHGEPCALIPGIDGQYRVYSGTNDNPILLTETLAFKLLPRAILFYPSLPTRGIRLRDFLWRTLALSKPYGVKMLALQVFIGLLSLLVPIAMGRLFNEVIPNAEYFLLGQWSILLIAAVVLGGLLLYQQVLLMLRLRFKLSLTLQAGLWDRFLRLPVYVIHKFEIGDLAARSFALNQVQQLLSGAVIQGLLSVVFAIFPLGLMFYYSWRLSLIVLLITLLTFVFYGVCFTVIKRYQTYLLAQRANVSSLVVQMLQNISRIRTEGAESRFYHAWLHRFMESLQSFNALNRWSVYLSTWQSVVPVGLSLIIFGVTAAFSPPIPFGSFIAFFSAYGLFSAAIFALSQLLLSVAPVMPWLQRIEPLLNESCENAQVTQNTPILKGAIRFENVSFGYEGQPLILNNISLSIEPGECIGIVGASGAGKSTLIRLLLGFIQPTNGNIFYDEQVLSQLNLTQLRQQLGVVLQQDTLLAGTIFDNLSDGHFLEEAKALEILDLVNLREMIEKLPMGLHTVLLDGGLTLSAGERQRLLIARALIQSPRILLLDEASSALDNVSQAKIHHHLKQVKQTKIMIAQRTSTLSMADRVYKLEAGTVVPARS